MNEFSWKIHGKMDEILNNGNSQTIRPKIFFTRGAGDPILLDV